MSPECIGREIICHKYSTRHNDIWSLGVVLVNMISRCNPWTRYATTQDKYFAAYLHDNNFLQQTFGISNEANTILRRIFNLNPLCRISLPELRNEILKLNTFFSAEEDTSINSLVPHNEVDLPTTSINQACNSPLKPEDHYHSRKPQIDEAHFLDSLSPCTKSSAIGAMLVADTGSVNSGQESEGPITPEAKAVDPGTEVSDLGDMINGLSSLMVVTGPGGNTEIVGTHESLPKLRKPFTKHADLFRNVMGKLTGVQQTLLS